MKNKIIGILVCMLLIVTAFTATGALNVKNTYSLNENNYIHLNQNNLADSHNFITISIVAKVTSVVDTNNLLGGSIKVDDKITGKYIYDSLVEDFYPGIPDYSIYMMNFSPCIFQVKAGNLVFKTNQTNPDNLNFYIEIFDNYGYFGDVYYVLSFNNMPLSNGLIVRYIYWSLQDQNSTVLSDDSLPTTAPILSKWNINELGITGYDPSNPAKEYQITAEVTKATKSRTRDIYFTTLPILNWLLERFPILKHLLVL